MKYSDLDRTIALGGIYQAVSLVQQIAQRGIADSDAMAGSINSLFQLNPVGVAEVFGEPDGVKQGLRILYKQLSGEVQRDNELTGYLLSLIQLERKLSKDDNKMQLIKQGIEQTQARLIHFSTLHSNILASLAEIYTQNISNLQPRIMVKGEPVYLQNPDNINRIRSLLLAGIRAAILWRQTGGRRRTFLFARKTYVEQAKRLLNQLA